MAIQLSVTARNDRLDAIETSLGASPVLKIFDGVLPANCAALDSGSVLATLNLPADSFASAAAGSKAKLGTWDDNAADATGRARHFRFFDNLLTECKMQGIVAMSWLAATAYAVGDYVTNDGGKLYICAAAGTSAGAGGPTGTGTGIVDGTAQWDYVQAATDMAVDNAEFVLGQQFTVTTFTLSEANA